MKSIKSKNPVPIRECFLQENQEEPGNRISRNDIEEEKREIVEEEVLASHR